MIETKIVYCKKYGKLKHPFIELSACEKCEYHKGYKILFAGTESIPEKKVVLCSLPVEIMISEFVQDILPDKEGK